MTRPKRSIQDLRKLVGARPLPSKNKKKKKKRKKVLQFVNRTEAVCVPWGATAQQVKNVLKKHGVCILPATDPETGAAILRDTDPLRGQYNTVLRDDKQITLSRDKLYGREDMTRKECAGVKFPGKAAGMVNVYSGWYLPFLTVLHTIFTEVIYPESKKADAKPLRLWPNRMRVQMPYGKAGENSHMDHNGIDDIDFDKPTYGVIAVLSDGRPFEYCADTHTKAFNTELRKHYKFTRDKHYVQFHLENPDTKDPLGLRARWARVHGNAGDLIIFDKALIHRIAANAGKRAIWSGFITIEPEWDGYSDPEHPKLATPDYTQRTVSNRDFVCPHQTTGSLRDSCIFATLGNYQPHKWPSYKPAFYYSGESINHVKFKPQYTKPAPLRKDGTPYALARRPVWPTGLNCHFDWKTADPQKLRALHIPVAAYLHLDKWAFDPTKLEPRLQVLLGLKDQ